MTIERKAELVQGQQTRQSRIAKALFSDRSNVGALVLAAQGGTEQKHFVTASPSADDKVKSNLTIQKSCDPADAIHLLILSTSQTPHYPDTATPPPEKLSLII